MEQVSNPVREWLVTPIETMPLLYHWTCPACQVSNVAFSLPGKRIDGFSPPVTCMSPSSTRKANKQGGSFQAQFSIPGVLIPSVTVQND